MVRKVTVGILAAAALAPAGAAAANGIGEVRELAKPAATRPSSKVGRNVVRAYLAAYAEGMDAKLVIGGCAPKGRLSVVCRARITKNGKTIDRYRVTTTNYSNASASLEAHVRKVS